MQAVYMLNEHVTQAAIEKIVLKWMSVESSTMDATNFSGRKKLVENKSDANQPRRQVRWHNIGPWQSQHRI